MIRKCSWNFVALPPPIAAISFSGYSIVGQSYSIHCTADVIANLMVEPEMKLLFQNSTVTLASTRVLTHSVHPRGPSDSGLYTCIVNINIPQAGIANLNSSATHSVTVECKCIV